MHLFYRPDISGSVHTLDPEESRHCVKVLRMKPGQSVFLTDGAGGLGKAELIEANPRSCVLQVAERFERHPAYTPKLHVAIAPTKNMDRFEWFLEKATECGIEAVWPIICQNSERTVVKHERLEKILISAMKQSQRRWLPVLNPAMKFGQFLQQSLPRQRFIAWCGETEKPLFQHTYQAGEDAVVLIGPEGDFSEEEFLAARHAGFVAVSLGDFRLRTETAALVCCIGFNLLNKSV